MQGRIQPAGPQHARAGDSARVAQGRLEQSAWERYRDCLAELGDIEDAVARHNMGRDTLGASEMAALGQRSGELVDLLRHTRHLLGIAGRSAHQRTM